MIEELIVVEGRDDVVAVKAAVDAEIITTNGFGYDWRLVETLKKISRRRGIIIFTDPDYVGEQIRRDLSSRIPGCKHAFLPQSKSTKKGDIGIENASREDIIEALEKARATKMVEREIFTRADLLDHGLIGASDSKDRRDRLGESLGIGYGNGKQFLNRLNSFGVTREEFIRGIEGLNNG